MAFSRDLTEAKRKLEEKGIEPLTSCMQSRHSTPEHDVSFEAQLMIIISTNLSYTPLALDLRHKIWAHNIQSPCPNGEKAGPEHGPLRQESPGVTTHGLKQQTAPKLPLGGLWKML